MPTPDALVGTVLNERYRVLSLIGGGGAATVLKAEDVKHGRQVAVKLLRGEVSTFGGSDRFAREIAILATLQHPHILPLLDSGVVDGQPYYVMPYVPGDSLRDRLNRERRIPTQDAVRILLDVCDALRYAHEFGIVHRDIKPENILLSGRHAVVADFGVARAAEQWGGEYQTTAGIALGTPTYMAPEQAVADPSVDFRADIYAVGVVGYEMLAGQPPFTGGGPAHVLAAHVTEPPPPLEAARPDLPADLTHAIMRCLEKRPEARWPTAAALATALEPYLLTSGAVTPAHTRSIQVVRRQRRLWLGAGVAATIVAALAVWLLRPPSRPTLGTIRKLASGPELELDPVLSPDGKLLAYAAGRNGELRINVRQLDGGDPVVVANAVGGNQRAPQWSADGTRLVFQADGSIYQAPALGGRADVLIEGDRNSRADSPALSPDGSSLAFVQAGELRISPTGGSAPAETVVRDGAAHSIAWSPDGERLAYVSGNRDFVLGEALLGNIAPSTLLIVPRGGGTPVAVTDGRSLAVSPVWWDERTLIYVSNRDGVRDVYLQGITRNGQPSGPPQRLTTGIGAQVARLSTDRRRLTVGVLNQVSNVWAVAIPATGTSSARQAEPLTAGSQVIEDLDILPLGGWLLFDSNLNGNQDIYVLSLRGKRPARLSQDPADEFGPTWSPNGKEIAYYAVQSGIRHIFVMRSTGRGARQVTADSLQDHQPQWAPDGERLVFYRRNSGGRDRIFVVARAADSSWGTPTMVTDEPGTGATWSRDGRWIAFSDTLGRIRVITPDGRTSRVVADPARVGDRPLRRPQWDPFESILYARTDEPGGGGAIWRLGLNGGTPRAVLRFDDRDRPSFRDDFTTDGDRLYFTVSQFESSLWLIDLTTQ